MEKKKTSDGFINKFLNVCIFIMNSNLVYDLEKNSENEFNVI